MIVTVSPPSGMTLIPENSEEQAILDEWSMQQCKVESIQRTTQGEVTSLVLTHTNG